MKDLNMIFKEFCEIAEGRCAFSLNGGAYYEGYIVEIHDDHFVFGEGGPMAGEKNLSIPVEDLDLLSLGSWI